MLKLLFVSALIVLAACTAASAGPEHPNAWGVYLAPTTHRLAEGTSYAQVTTNTYLEGAIFYRRMISGRTAARLEARIGERGLDAEISLPSGVLPFRVAEYYLEVPLIVETQQPFRLGQADAHVLIGVGLRLGVLISQDILTSAAVVVPAGMPTESGFGGSYSVAWVASGGLMVGTADDSAVFGMLRLQSDLDTFGTTDDTFAREYVTYGFLAGLQWAF